MISIEFKSGKWQGDLWLLYNNPSAFFIARVRDARRIVYIHRICVGHGKLGKSWNFTLSFSRPGKS